MNGVTIVGTPAPPERDARPREPALLTNVSALLEHLAPLAGHSRRREDEITGGACVTSDRRPADRNMSHYAQLVVELTILALAIFLGSR